tara:strand:- start:592 stop:1518 length:927 start_codon:yes stop_codon:yes gene_type:complete
MAEENTQAVEETDIEEGEIVELDPVEEDQPVTTTTETNDVEAEAVVEDVSETEETKKQDEHEDYSAKVKKRINTLTRKLREAERGRDSAYEYAKSTAAQNEQLRARSSTLDRSFLTEAESRLKSQKTQAMTALKSAHENQDYEKVAKAQDVLAKIAVEESRVQASKTALEQETQVQNLQQNYQQPVQPQPAPQLDEKQQKWVEQNEWFGEDEIMTLAAFSIDQKLIQEGYDPKTDEYYNEVDRMMRSEFPHKFEESSVKTKPQQKVASAGRVAGNTSSKRQVKLSPAEVQMAKKLNVPLTEYAKYVKR